MLQGYSRYSLRETLHFDADFRGLDNSERVGDARRQDEAMVVAVTAECAFSAQVRVRNGRASLRLSRANKRQRCQ